MYSRQQLECLKLKDIKIIAKQMNKLVPMTHRITGIHSITKQDKDIIINGILHIQDVISNQDTLNQIETIYVDPSVAHQIGNDEQNQTQNKIETIYVDPSVSHQIGTSPLPVQNPVPISVPPQEIHPVIEPIVDPIIELLVNLFKTNNYPAMNSISQIRSIPPKDYLFGILNAYSGDIYSLVNSQLNELLQNIKLISPEQSKSIYENFQKNFPKPIEKIQQIERLVLSENEISQLMESIENVEQVKNIEEQQVETIISQYNFNETTPTMNPVIRVDQIDDTLSLMNRLNIQKSTEISLKQLDTLLNTRQSIERNKEVSLDITERNIKKCLGLI